MVEHTGNHYKLITYKDKEIFRFVKYLWYEDKVVEKCMKSRVNHYIIIFLSLQK